MPPETSLARWFHFTKTNLPKQNWSSNRSCSFPKGYSRGGQLFSSAGHIASLFLARGPGSRQKGTFQNEKLPFAGRMWPTGRMLPPPGLQINKKCHLLQASTNLYLLEKPIERKISGSNKIRLLKPSKILLILSFVK